MAGDGQIRLGPELKLRGGKNTSLQLSPSLKGERDRAKKRISVTDIKNQPEFFLRPDEYSPSRSSRLLKNAVRLNATNRAESPCLGARLPLPFLVPRRLRFPKQNPNRTARVRDTNSCSVSQHGASLPLAAIRNHFRLWGKPYLEKSYLSNAALPSIAALKAMNSGFCW